MGEREQVLGQLTTLRSRLKKAEADRDNGAAMLARHDIDSALEELYRCPDPAGVADPQEWGAAG